VAALRGHGLGCMLWLALPLVGEGTRARRRFEGSVLGIIPHHSAAVLDPRDPQVRRHCVDVCERALRDWSLDGLKIDFLDIYSRFESTPPGAGADCASVAEGAAWLVAEIGERMRQVNPLALLEFRQQYLGPRMRAAASMFRAGDCPGGGGENRLRTLDLRLLAGRSAVHSDMLLWSPSAPAETAAIQLIDVLFSVPQVSVRLDRVPPEHLEALRFWLGLWRERRATLLDGELEVGRPDLLYPAARARGDAGTVVAVYDERVVPLSAADPPPVLLANAAAGGRVVVDASGEAAGLAVTVRDCRGRPAGACVLRRGLQALEVPPGGAALLPG
jgi:alpha-galactosidase